MSDTLDSLLGIDPNETITAAAESTAIEPVPNSGAIAPIEGETVPAVIEADVVSSDDKDMETDFEFARRGAKDMIEKGRQALDSAIILAQSGDSPRAYEVVGKMLESIVNAQKELLDFHRARKEQKKKDNVTQSLLPTTGQNGSVTIEKAVFVGRASDLLREVKQLQKRVDEESKDE